MPDDLLRHVFGPQPYSSCWLWLAVLLTLALIGWYVGVFVWTLPSYRLRRIPVVRRLHAWLIRNRFARCVQRISGEHDVGRMPAPAACAAISRTVRSFLHQATGARAQYLQIGAMAVGELAQAAPLLTQLGDAQFNAESHIDVADMSARAQELIRSWT
ncbi:hypothetical protein A5753_07075 [Mycobacterium sp. 852002-51971_SCH5477799-a]|uniref:hypothetical protein n=1 Tax=Mycobacterium sp. 852002-51971_SCH5477799-a TaxID=1834106 RepID=UPI0008008A4E|nr:hypothetical protein [Mycobacterium sp. 852002-51971_SCH5477799-a]OBF66458.1 hypothetical protein A5753_07075 [Mycobacterium sp. 852002-51971_SCH5477799-a]